MSTAGPSTTKYTNEMQANIERSRTIVRTAKAKLPNNQGRYWLLTIRESDFEPHLPNGVVWIKGQLEEGEGGFVHWQVVCCFGKKVRFGTVKEVFGSTAHIELSRSAAANEYVHKDETAIDDTRFELGELPFKRNDATDWARIKEQAQAGRLNDIDADIYVRNYSSLKRIALDNMAPQPGERSVTVFWGPTGTGKSHRAWLEAGFDAYPKPPTTKWWDGYQPEKHDHVVIDEFDGQVGITHLLRWFDKYPCVVEQKGGGCCLIAKRIWITSNIAPEDWYPEGKPAQVAALMRRLTVIKLDKPYQPVAPQRNPPPLNDNARFWRNAPNHEGIPIGDVMEVPEWRDYLGDLLEDEKEVIEIE